MWQETSKEEAFKVMTNVCRHLVITHVVAPVPFSGKGIKLSDDRISVFLHCFMVEDIALSIE
jgi:hypothetical protein